LLGEDGTGRRSLARALHDASERKAEAFRSVHCEGLSANALGVALFGDADSDSPSGAVGALKAAAGGTLLLTEVHAMPRRTQTTLCAILRAGVLRGARDGDAGSTPLDVRLVATARQPLAQTPDFIRELADRLSSITLAVPPLRERTAELPALIAVFAALAAERFARPAPRPSPAFVEALGRHGWPGNLRELVGVTERAVALCAGDELGVDHVPPHLHPRGGVRATDAWLSLPFAEAKERAVASFERAYAERCLMHAAGNVSEAARVAGLDRSNFRRLMRRCELRAEDYRRD
jgi:two-component system response regulator HydG